GPIAACLVFGWLPCVLWIVLGVIFIGAVHDFSTLVASVRHGAGSIAEIARARIDTSASVQVMIDSSSTRIFSCTSSDFLTSASIWS
ncbi:MAG: hypothetical protein HP495_15015, partial [Nitrospira sp.]|nr:hypothetical protein [Nitrospira sp.]